MNWRKFQPGPQTIVVTKFVSIVGKKGSQWSPDVDNPSTECAFLLNVRHISPALHMTSDDFYILFNGDKWKQIAEYGLKCAPHLTIGDKTTIEEHIIQVINQGDT